MSLRVCSPAAPCVAGSSENGRVVRGDPRRTPLYGGVLIVLAMIAATVVTETSAPLGIRLVVYLLALAAAGAGVLMTLRDYS